MNDINDQILIKIPKGMLENYADNLYEAGYYSNAINIRRMIDEQVSEEMPEEQENK